MELHNTSFSIKWMRMNETLLSYSNPNGSPNNSMKYIQNHTGLIIYNITEEDQGNYICLIGNTEPLNATISLSVMCKICIKYSYTYGFALDLSIYAFKFTYCAFWNCLPIMMLFNYVPTF